MVPKAILAILDRLVQTQLCQDPRGHKVNLVKIQQFLDLKAQLVQIQLCQDQKDHRDQRGQTQPYLDRKDHKGQLELIQLCLVLLGQLVKLDRLVQTQLCLVPKAILAILDQPE